MCVSIGYFLSSIKMYNDYAHRGTFTLTQEESMKSYLKEKMRPVDKIINKPALDHYGNVFQSLYGI